jgi:hypothetical protein
MESKLRVAWQVGMAECLPLLRKRLRYATNGRRAEEAYIEASVGRRT